MNTPVLDRAAWLHDLQLGSHLGFTALSYAIQKHHGSVTCDQWGCIGAREALLQALAAAAKQHSSLRTNQRGHILRDVEGGWLHSSSFAARISTASFGTASTLCMRTATQCGTGTISSPVTARLFRTNQAMCSGS